MKQIKMAIYSLMITGGFIATSCGGDDDNNTPSLPPIGGYNNADEVASANLVAHFPFENNGNEIKSNTAPEITNSVSYSEGVKGQAATMSQGYFKYPQISDLSTTTGSITITCWAKLFNNGGDGGLQSTSVLFSMARENDWAGNINFMAETAWLTPNSDSLVIKGLSLINNNGNINWQDTRNVIKASPDELAEGYTPFPVQYEGRWAHYVLSWDSTGALFTIWVNGEKVSNAPWEARNEGEDMALSYSTPTFPMIGAFATVPAGTSEAWQKGLVGSLDEMRVYNKALTESEINALYQLEEAGR